jgi:hypothetical protein
MRRKDKLAILTGGEVGSASMQAAEIIDGGASRVPQAHPIAHEYNQQDTHHEHC